MVLKTGEVNDRPRPTLPICCVVSQPVPSHSHQPPKFKMTAQPQTVFSPCSSDKSTHDKVGNGLEQCLWTQPFPAAGCAENWRSQSLEGQLTRLPPCNKLPQKICELFSKVVLGSAPINMMGLGLSSQECILCIGKQECAQHEARIYVYCRTQCHHVQGPFSVWA